MPDNHVGLEQDPKMALAVQHLDQLKNMVVEVAPKVEMDGSPPGLYEGPG